MAGATGGTGGSAIANDGGDATGGNGGQFGDGGTGIAVGGGTATGGDGGTGGCDGAAVELDEDGDGYYDVTIGGGECDTW